MEEDQKIEKNEEPGAFVTKRGLEAGPSSGTLGTSRAAATNWVQLKHTKQTTKHSE